MSRLIVYLVMCSHMGAERSRVFDSLSRGAASTVKDKAQPTRVNHQKTSMNPKYKINTRTDAGAYVPQTRDEYTAQSTIEQNQASEWGDFMLYVFLAQLNIDKLEKSFKEFDTRDGMAQDLSQGHLGGLVDFTADSLNKIIQESESRINHATDEDEEKEKRLLDLVKSDPFMRMRMMQAALYKISTICDYSTVLRQANITIKGLYLSKEDKSELQDAGKRIKERYHKFSELIKDFEENMLCPSIQKHRNEALGKYTEAVKQFEKNVEESWYWNVFSRNPDVVHASWAVNLLGWNMPLQDWEGLKDPCTAKTNGELCFGKLTKQGPLGVDQHEFNMTSEASNKWNLEQSILQEFRKVETWNILFAEQCRKSPTKSLHDFQKKCNLGEQLDISVQAWYEPLKCVVDFHTEEFVKNAAKTLFWFIDLFDVEKLSLMILKVFHEEAAEALSAATTLKSLIKKGEKVVLGTVDPRVWVQLVVKTLQVGMKLISSAEEVSMCKDMGKLLLEFPAVNHGGPMGDSKRWKMTQPKAKILEPEPDDMS